LSEKEEELLLVPQYGGGKEELERTNLIWAVTMDETGSFQEVNATKADLCRELRVQKVLQVPLAASFCRFSLYSILWLEHCGGGGGVTPKRDLRAVDISFPNQLASFLVRDGAILINLEAFKAIIKHDRLMLFATEATRHNVIQQFCPFLQYRLTYTRFFINPFKSSHRLLT